VSFRFQFHRESRPETAAAANPKSALLAVLRAKGSGKFPAAESEGEAKEHSSGDDKFEKYRFGGALPLRRRPQPQSMWCFPAK